MPGAGGQRCGASKRLRDLADRRVAESKATIDKDLPKPKPPKTATHWSGWVIFWMTAGEGQKALH